MKKLILVLAMLVASPVFAALDVNIVAVDSDTVAIVYTGADTANLPRAFALTVTINGTGTFTAINGYKTGESTAASPGFGIFPARIQIDSAGTVTDYGSPLADTADPGAAGTGLGTSTVILEFGSLYSGSANAPLTSGTLCTLDFNPGTATQISLADETTYRGGIVLEDGTQLTDTAVFSIVTLPGQATNPTPANGSTTVAYNAVTLSWTAGANATSRDVYFGTAAVPVTKVIDNGTALTYSAGDLIPLKTYYWRVDEKNSFGTTTGTVWSFTVAAPTCWGYMGFPCGDATGDNKVNVLDLAKVKAAWGATSPATAYDACADFTKDGKVNVLDLAKIKAKWGQTLTTCP